MDYLKAVFWEYPQYSERESLIAILKEKSNMYLYLWIMRRFLEYGRVVDVFSYFRVEEIAEYLQNLKLTPYTLKKWKRMIEVYGNS